MTTVTKLGNIELIKGDKLAIIGDHNSTKEFVARQLAINAKEKFGRKSAILWVHEDILDAVAFEVGSKEDLCINQALLNSEDDYEDFLKAGEVDLILLTDRAKHFNKVNTNAATIVMITPNSMLRTIDFRKISGFK